MSKAKSKMRAPDRVGHGSQTARVPGRSYYVLAVVALIYMFSQLDRKLPLILIQAIKNDLHLSDTEIGLATGVVFTLVYASFGIPIARLADRKGKLRVITWSLIIWSVITGLNGFASNFWQFAAARAGVAIGEGGATPSAQSLLADFFPAQKLGLASGIFLAAASVGYLLALAGGGWLNDFASWRVAMMVMAVPGIFLAVLARFTISEPRRVATAGEQMPPFLESVSALWRIRTYRHLFFAALSSGIYHGAIGAFIPTYVIRNFHFSAAYTGWTYGLLAAGAGVSASLLGGAIADHFGPRDARSGLSYVFLIALGSAPLTIAALFAGNYFSFLGLMFLPQASITAWSGPTTVIIMALVDKRVRALAISVYLFSTVGVGFSVGPVLAGALSDGLHPIVAAASLKWSLVALSLIPLWTSVHYLLAIANLRRDLALPRAD